MPKDKATRKTKASKAAEGGGGKKKKGPSIAAHNISHC